MPVETRSSDIRPVRRRSRRGCLVCRQHRLKCDEKGPTCGSCNRLGRTCKWGLRASFHPSRVSQLSSSDSNTLREIELGRQYQNALTFVDETEEIEHEYDGPDETSIQRESNQGAAIDSTPEIENNRLSVIEEGHTGTFRAQNDHHTVSDEDSLSQSDSGKRISRRTSSSQTRQYLHPRPPPILNPPTYTAGNNISVISFQKSTHEYFRTLLPRKVISWPVNDHVKACLLSAYFQSASKWCEVTDSLKTFSTSSSHLIIESPAFAAAAAALSSIMVMKGDEFSVLLADELYSFARTALRGFKSEHREGGVLAATLLCMYGSASGKTREGQSTLHECAELLQDHGLQNAPRGVLTACFWVFARQDIWASFSIGRLTLIPTESWEITRCGLDVPIQDSYSKLAIWIVARIVNELSKRPSDINLNTLQDFWEELQAWVVERPLSVRCVMEVESSGDSPFPTILFSNPSAVCGNLYYHAGCILLLATEQILYPTSAMASPICHARRIIAISMTNNDPANLVNNIHPLCVAARQLHAAVEKMAVLKHLKEIQDCTGWKTERYILELQEFWVQ